MSLQIYGSPIKQKLIELCMACIDCIDEQKAKDAMEYKHLTPDQLSDSLEETCNISGMQLVCSDSGISNDLTINGVNCTDYDKFPP